MIELFGIAEDKAVGRINRDWSDKPIVGPHVMVYHETAEYWAKTIYFGKDSSWWLPSTKPLPRQYP